MYRHWAKRHNSDGAVKDSFPSIPADSNETSAVLASPASFSFENHDGDHNSNNVLTFSSTFSENNGQNNNFSHPPCPLFDDGAPHSAIGFIQLRPFLGLDNTMPISLSIEPERLMAYETWLYGNGSHASSKRSFLGSYVLHVTADSGNKIGINHLVMNGSSLWIIGSKVTHVGDLLHIGGNKILLLSGNGFCNSLQMVDFGLHSYINGNRFDFGSKAKYSKPVWASSASSTKDTSTWSNTLQPWNELRRIEDKVHKHTCSHSAYSVMRTLLQRNELWTKAVHRYLAELVQSFLHWSASSTPFSFSKASLCTLCRELSDLVLADHFYLDNLLLFHMVDAFSPFSVAVAVESASPSLASIAFKQTWLSHF